MLLPLSKGIQKIQVFGDSLLVIDWLKLKNPPKNINLKPLYEEHIILASLFQGISYQYIFSENKMLVDHLSKMVLQVEDRTWNMWEGVDDTIYST